MLSPMKLKHVSVDAAVIQEAAVYPSSREFTFLQTLANKISNSNPSSRRKHLLYMHEIPHQVLCVRPKLWSLGSPTASQVLIILRPWNDHALGRVQTMGILLENKYENANREEGDHVKISESPLAVNPKTCGWEIPELAIPYKLQDPHPMSTRLCQESHEWLARHGVDKQLGPELWKRVVKGNTPDVMTHILPSVSEIDFFLAGKYMLVLYSLDTVLDDSPVGKDVEKSLDAILEVITVLMWKYPEEPSLLECLPHLYNLASSVSSRHSVEAFKAQLIEAKHRKECNLDLSPVGAAWNDFWADYLGYGLPHEFNVRLAQGLLEWLTSCFEEAQYRSSETTPGLVDYIAFRRKVSAVKPAVVMIDAIIHQYAPGIPNSLFYSPPMQRLLLAITDLVSWHNDVFSVYKECIVNKDKHNLVHIMSDEHKCSYEEAATKFVAKMLSGRIDDMESAIADLTAAASADLQPAVEMYATTCRNWVSGSHEWHSKSARYRSAPKLLVPITVTETDY